MRVNFRFHPYRLYIGQFELLADQCCFVTMKLKHSHWHLVQHCLHLPRHRVDKHTDQVDQRGNLAANSCCVIHAHGTSTRGEKDQADCIGPSRDRDRRIARTRDSTYLDPGSHQSILTASARIAGLSLPEAASRRCSRQIKFLRVPDLGEIKSMRWRCDPAGTPITAFQNLLSPPDWPFLRPDRH